MIKTKTYVSGSPPYAVSAEVKQIGSDLLVIVTGGDTPHIGSVAVAVPRASLRDRRVMSSTSSVYNLPGHKDQVLSQRVAEALSAKLNRTVVVVAGFHLDNISKTGITTVLKNAEELAHTILASLQQTKV